MDKEKITYKYDYRTISKMDKKNSLDLLQITSLLEPVVTNQQMRSLDMAINSQFGIPLILLMENAGRAVAECAIEYLQVHNIVAPKILILAGPGNNGGDAIVSVRYLVNRFPKIQIILLILPKANYHNDALINYEIINKFISQSQPLASIIKIIEVTHTRKLSLIKNFNPDLIIDGIFGTGFRGTPEGVFREAIELINQSNAYKIAIDIPSGVNGDTGEIWNLAVKAHQTVSMGLYKRGHWLYPGKSYCGMVKIADLGVAYNNLFTTIISSNKPPKLKSLFSTETYLLTSRFIKQIFPARRPNGHKGTFGSVTVLAGGKGYSGAACLTSLSALKSGVGLVRLCFPISINSAVEKKLTEVIKVPLPTTSEGTLALSGFDQIKKLLDQTDVLIIGPGITTHPETKALIQKVMVSSKKIPIVLDADGINNITIPMLLKLPANQRAHIVLTPHPGEFSRLIGIAPEIINRERIDLCELWAKKLGTNIVLKGAPTVIGTPDGKVFINPTGNSGLAKGGSGDVLTGLIAGFIAQGATPIYASCLGVYLHGLSADLKVKSTTEYCLTASDLINQLPKAIKQILSPENSQKDIKNCKP
ncbi:MAG: NAD(P)H-hydrate dehydratase [candidate division WOR-3 bacterium]|nr:NAD(P)H-hydrate dehydratase [candidate division WOR-3 bacterium]